ncbi:MAG: hypothetical protein MUC49_05140 [Raineya sp.]|jgi:hypothetical protein|nr:hypothetical protein [Raineya sp.]
MANRSYLYTTNKDFTKIRDVSEWKYEVPLFYKVLLGCDTQICESLIWNYKHPIAIKGDFKKGLQKLYDFLSYLKTQGVLNEKSLEQFIKETQDFFEENKDRKLDYFFLEAGEVYSMMSDIGPIEDHIRILHQYIISISEDIDNILSEKNDVLDFKKISWLGHPKRFTNSISVYWTDVTYFSFNNS